MATTTSHNKKSSAVKRILSEAREFSETDTEFTANPLENNIFEWHFTLRGPSASEFQEGIYHGRILLPAEYPFRPPDVMLLTPNGRWELNKKICLTFTGFHEEMWQPAWGIRTALIGVQAFMGAKAEAAVGIGSLNYPEEEREKLAKRSRDWTCPVCGVRNAEILREEGVRKEETVPEGLSVDPKKSGEEADEEKPVEDAIPDPESDIKTQTRLQEQTEVKSSAAHFFGPSGPPDTLVASLIEGQARRDASMHNASIDSSRVPSGSVTPIDDDESLRRRIAVSNESSPTQNMAHLPPQIGTASQSPAPSSSHAIPPPRLSAVNAQSAGQAVPPPEAHRLDEPEHRLAVLDRAIATVLFLLLALVLRRVLNSLS